MLVYRVGKTQYADDLKGTGSKLFGGRWNQVDTPCIYTSASRALAVLEYSANVNIDFIPRALSMIIFEIDEKVIREFKTEELPGDWKDSPAPYSTKAFGTQLLQEGAPILRVPSIIIPEEFNYILNPLADKIPFKLIEIKDFVYDLRVKNI